MRLKKEMSNEVKLHSIKCYNIQARGIKHLSYCQQLRKLAVLRNDFSIELWNFTNAPFIERVLSGSVDCALEQICWAETRLFSVSISGNGLIEYDIKTLSKKRNLLLTGDKGICIDYHRQTERLAVGTEEGFINIFDVSDDDIQFVRVLDKQDHRIICCKFNDAGDCIVSGSIDAVKVWSVKTGHVIHKMSTGRTDQHQETIVWCVEVLKDFTIITGDSRGRITFWDGSLGTQIDWLQASNSDILCLSLSNDQNSVICSGVEQFVRKYVRIATNRDGIKLDQWIRNAKRAKLHTHDILSLATIANDHIVSGGIDGFLSISSDEIKIVERIGPFLKHPFAATAQEARLMLMRYSNYLEVWRLAKAANEVEDSEQNGNMNDDDDDEILKPVVKKSSNQFYKMSIFPEKYVELRSKGDEMIISSAISNNGKWIAYSTSTTIRLFQFEIENSKPSLIRVKNVPDELTSCVQMIFTKDSNKLITINANSICTIFDLSSDAIEPLQTIELDEHHHDLCHLADISNCSKFLIIASLDNHVSIWCLKKGKYVHKKNLPKHVCAPTAIKIHENNPALIIAYADNRIFEYNLDEFYIQSSLNPTVANNSSSCAITNITIDPRNLNTIVFAQNNSINVIRREHVEEKVSAKKMKAENGHKECPHTHKIVKKFDTHLIHLEWMGIDEILILEMNPVALMENLPAPLRKKVFGAM